MGNATPCRKSEFHSDSSRSCWSKYGMERGETLQNNCLFLFVIPETKYKVLVEISRRLLEALCLLVDLFLAGNRIVWMRAPPTSARTRKDRNVTWRSEGTCVSKCGERNVRATQAHLLKKRHKKVRVLTLISQFPAIINYCATFKYSNHNQIQYRVLSGSLILNAVIISYCLIYYKSIRTKYIVIYLTASEMGLFEQETCLVLSRWCSFNVVCLA